MPESYFPLDVNFFDHPKIVGLSDAALRLYLSSVAYANRLVTDGFIANAIASRLIEWDWNDPDARTPDHCAAELVEAKLWHPCEGGYRIHDFLDHNRSKAERLEARDKERDRKAAYRRRQRPDGTDDPGDGGVPTGQGVTGTVNTETETYTETDARKVNTVVEFAAPRGATTRPGGVHPGTVRQVFDAWTQATGKTRARLDPKRDRLIRQALNAYPVEDLIDAVRGWQNSPHHCGQNERGTVYNDLGLLLRDAEHIERFRDLARDGPPGPAAGRRTLQALGTYQAMLNNPPEEVTSSGNGVGTVDRDRRPTQRELAGPADRAADGP